MLLLAPLPLALPTGHSTWASARDLQHSPAPLCSACATSRPRPRRRTTSTRPHQRTSIDRPLSTRGGGSWTGGRLSMRLEKVQGALGAGWSGSTGAGEQMRPRPPRLLLLAPLVGPPSPALALQGASGTRRSAYSSPSRAGWSRTTGGRACRAVQELGVDLERLTSTLVRPSRSL